MSETAVGPKAATAKELKSELEAERTGEPFLVLRDEGGDHRVVALAGRAGPLWVGRRPTVELALAWDAEVSGIHAQLAPSAGEWTLVDDGLSLNGSFVNGERVAGRRLLRDGDMLRFGATVVLYRAPGALPASTAPSSEELVASNFSETQMRVLVALCRPYKDALGTAAPASNRQIAEEVFLGVDAVKAQMRSLFAKFGVEDLPQNRKRAALAERALQSGLISPRDL